MVTVHAGMALSLLLVGCDELGERESRAPTPAVPDTSSGSARKGLPKWSDIGSGHPEGAFNPPYARLHLGRDGARCGKAWYRAKRAPSEDEFKLVTVDGSFESRYIDVAGRVGIPVECPKGTADALKKVQAATAASAKKAQKKKQK